VVYGASHRAGQRPDETGPPIISSLQAEILEEESLTKPFGVSRRSCLGGACLTKSVTIQESSLNEWISVKANIRRLFNLSPARLTNAVWEAHVLHNEALYIYLYAMNGSQLKSYLGDDWISIRHD
jgi:hypothetical protein